MTTMIWKSSKSINHKYVPSNLADRNFGYILLLFFTTILINVQYFSFTKEKLELSIFNIYVSM